MSKGSKEREPVYPESQNDNDESAEPQACMELKSWIESKVNVSGPSSSLFMQEPQIA